mmetsp:Transcript_5597/g.13982  ORF Transcript_5597/g.13982 Transcript_5597/m.13982 type:complete len:313 (+) Transcript_5597:1123-2061(+)
MTIVAIIPFLSVLGLIGIAIVRVDGAYQLRLPPALTLSKDALTLGEPPLRLRHARHASSAVGGPHAAVAFAAGQTTLPSRGDARRALELVVVGRDGGVVAAGVVELSAVVADYQFSFLLLANVTSVRILLLLRPPTPLRRLRRRRLVERRPLRPTRELPPRTLRKRSSRLRRRRLLLLLPRRLGREPLLLGGFGESQRGQPGLVTGDALQAVALVFGEAGVRLVVRGAVVVIVGRALVLVRILIIDVFIPVPGGVILAVLLLFRRRARVGGGFFFPFSVAIPVVDVRLLGGAEIRCLRFGRHAVLRHPSATE